MTGATASGFEVCLGVYHARAILGSGTGVWNLMRDKSAVWHLDPAHYEAEKGIQSMAWPPFDTESSRV